MSTPADFNPEGIEAAEEVSDLANTKAEVDAVEGLEVDKDLTRRHFLTTLDNVREFQPNSKLLSVCRQR